MDIQSSAANLPHKMTSDVMLVVNEPEGSPVRERFKDRLLASGAVQSIHENAKPPYVMLIRFDPDRIHPRGIVGYAVCLGLAVKVSGG
ncbi:MAG: hypothetical protein OEW12_02790 [Deltaproteobacteria bacterium]|nr:hypothetical protein [Deltaproteobacteria bacterium]